MKAFKKYRALWDFTILKKKEDKKGRRDEWKKNLQTKKNHKKFLSKTPFFLSNLCRAYHSIRARQSDQKRLQNLETEREKKQEHNEKTLGVLWPKKRDARSELWDVLARKVWITLSSTSSSSSRALKSNRERSPFSSRRRRRQKRVKTTKWWSEIIILVLLEAKEGRTKSARRSRTCWCLFYRLRFSIA